MLIKVNNSPTYYDNELIYSTYRETVHSLYAKKCVFPFTPSTCRVQFCVTCGM